MKNLLDIAAGSTIVIMRHYHTEEGAEKMHVPSCSYHFHFLIFKDSERKNVSLLCLDNDEFMSAQAMGLPLAIEDETSIKSCIDDMLKIMVEAWHEKELLLYGKSQDLKNIFVTKSPQEYWDKFNKIKEKSYSQNRQKYLDYVSEYKHKPISEKIRESKSFYSKAQQIMFKEGNASVSEAYKNEEHLILN